jgi:serine/threonine protein kinase
MATGSTSSNVVGVHYRVGKKIGEGSFGVIFEGTNLLNQQQVAIKFEPRKSDAPQLRDEYRTYKILVGCRESNAPSSHSTAPGRENHVDGGKHICIASELSCYSVLPGRTFHV